LEMIKGLLQEGFWFFFLHLFIFCIYIFLV